MMKRFLSIVLAVTLIISCFVVLAETPKTAEMDVENKAETMTEGFGDKFVSSKKDGYKIFFLENYNGNSYHQTIEAQLNILAETMKADGTLSSFQILQANQDTATQIAQIQSCILDDADAIIIDPTSASALNGALEEAWDAGIPCIIVNDGPVTSEKCYQLNFDNVALAENAIQKLIDLMGGSGKIINIRGLAGNGFDESFNSGVMNIIKANPSVEIVAEVYGEWTTSVSQQQVASVLPGLDKVDGVMGQGGDAYGAAMAFEAAGREVPIIIGGNRGNFLNWWKEAKDAKGYETFSWACNPWNPSAGLYIIVDVLRGGYDIPRIMIMGALEITQDTVDEYYGLADDFVAFQDYNHDWIVASFYNK